MNARKNDLTFHSRSVLLFAAYCLALVYHTTIVPQNKVDNDKDS